MAVCMNTNQLTNNNLIKGEKIKHYIFAGM